MKQIVSNTHRKFIVAAGIGYLIVLSVIRGFAPPKDWAEAHWLIHYSDGYIKRGLVGTLMKPLVSAVGPVSAELLIHVVMYSQFIILIGVLIAIGARCIIRSRWSPSVVWSVVVFATSPLTVVQADLIGYFDNFVLVFAAATLLLIHMGRPKTAAALLSIGLLIHENLIVIGYPAALYLVYLSRFRSVVPDVRSIFRRIAPYLPLFVVPVVVAFFIFIYQNYFMNPDLQGILTRYIRQFAFVKDNYHAYVPFWCTTPFLSGPDTPTGEIVERFTGFTYWVRYLPSVIFFLFVLNGKRFRQERRRIFDGVIALAITVLPLAMHLVAFDTSRIWAYPVFVGFVLLWTRLETSPPAVSGEEGSFIPIVGALIAMSQTLFQNILMDRGPENVSEEIRFLLIIPALILVAFAMQKPLSSSSDSAPLTIE